MQNLRLWVNLIACVHSLFESMEPPGTLEMARGIFADLQSSSRVLIITPFGSFVNSWISSMKMKYHLEKFPLKAL